MALISIAGPVFTKKKICARSTRGSSPRPRACHTIEMVFVDDDSSDGSAQILGKVAPHDLHVCVVHLSRNFGHHPASTAAVRFTSGDAVVLTDGDLQDPLDLVREGKKGPGVVLGRCRSRSETGARGLLIGACHGTFRWPSGAPMPWGVGVFSSMSAQVATEIARMPERNRYLQDLRWRAGHRCAEVW
jgi:polyisoprenyl-phosphate glycosyltransferase